MANAAVVRFSWRGIGFAFWEAMKKDEASRRHRLALVGTAGAGVATLGAIVARIGADEHWPIDHAVREQLRAQKRPRARAALRAAGSAGTVGVYAPATLLAMWLVARRSGTHRALPIGGAMLGAAAVSWLLKRAIHRPRPVPVSRVVNERPSFPSGHATRASAAAFTIAYVLVRERMVHRHLAFPLAGAIAAAVGVSRTYADAHWTTDVIGGWAVGGATAACAALCYEQLREAIR